MAPADYLSQLSVSVAGFSAGLRQAATLDRGWDLPVPGCPDWSVRDLAHHLGEVERWVVHAIHEHNPSAPTPEWPSDDALVDWYDAGAATLRERLATDPATPAWTFGPDKNVAFWQRRQAHEHTMHLADLHQALGRPSAPIDPDLAADGVDEVVGMMWPRQLRLGRAVAPDGRLDLTATDTGHTWTIGGGEPAASLAAPAAALLLALWHRIPAEDPSLAWSGAVAHGRAILALPLAP